jgi:hypothetical protein
MHVGDFNFPRLVEFGASISGERKLYHQQVFKNWMCTSV